jgi:hypothetical protein
MQQLTFNIRDFIAVSHAQPMDAPWPTRCPFELSFSRRPLTRCQTAAITGTGIYMITKLPQREIIYLGLFRPLAGDIIADRWARHLQTITWRGARIGLGPAPKGRTDLKVARRRDNLLSVASHPELQSVIRAAYDHDREARYTSTGNDTSVNRTRFANEHWAEFSAATQESLLDNFEIDLIRMHLPPDQATADHQIEEIERRLLSEYKPVCNYQYRAKAHHGQRHRNAEALLIQSVRQVMTAVTSYDATHRITLKP